MMTKGAPTVLRESLRWLDAHLAGNGGTERSPVRIHVNRDGWLGLDDWPPTMPEQVRYLQPGGRLGDAVPPDTAPTSTFTYDPADPTPTVGGRLLSPAGGYRNDTRLADALRRADVHRRRAVAGRLRRRKPGRSNCRTPATTRTTTCSSGSARSTRRADPATSATDIAAAQADSGTITIELDAVAHNFRAGSRIRVLIAGGSHPRFARNLGTGEPLLTGRQLRPATHTVHLGGRRVAAAAACGPPGRHAD